MNQRDDSKNGKFIGLALCVSVFELLLLVLYLKGFFSITLLILAHITVLLMISFFVYQSAKKKEDLRIPLLLLLAVFGAGLAGSLGFLLQAALYPLFKRISTPMNVWFEELFPEYSPSPLTRIFQRIKSGWDHYELPTETSSLRDIFIYGTLAQKQTVLDMIIKDFEPIYAPILKKALEDSSNTVRIQAAATVAKIDFDFEMELSRLLAKQKEFPNDPEHLLDLAKYYDSYSSLQILGPTREKEAQEIAIDYYQQYIKEKPTDHNAWFSVGRIIFHSKDFLRFISWHTEYIKLFKTDPSIVHVWHLEALYRLRRYEELASASRVF